MSQPVGSDEQPAPSLQLCEEHCELLQLPLSQATSHAHASWQLTSRQAFEPLQATSHRPSAQWTSRHARKPVQVTEHAVSSYPQSTVSHAWLVEHVISHDRARSQSMSPHALLALHAILQDQPLGHWTLPQAAGAAHSTSQVRSRRSQPPLQTSGHGAGTQ